MDYVHDHNIGQFNYNGSDRVNNCPDKSTDSLNFVVLAIEQIDEAGEHIGQNNDEHHQFKSFLLVLQTF